MCRRALASKFRPARANSSSRHGTSKRSQLKPERSQPLKNSSTSPATSAKVGQLRTISSVMPCISVVSFGIGTPGFSSQHFAVSVPSGSTRIAASSMMRSCRALTPVDSMSNTTSGLSSWSASFIT